MRLTEEYPDQKFLHFIEKKLFSRKLFKKRICYRIVTISNIDYTAS